MADEPEKPNPDPEEPPSPGEPEPEPAPDAKPHPLEPGGERFNEVYGRMKDAERREADMRERLARVEGAQQAQQKPPQQPQTYTNEQLQALVDQGRITHAQMADQIAWQRQQQGEQALETKLNMRERSRNAFQEVETYLSKVPALADQSSPTFREVAKSAREISTDLGRDVSDPIVQRLALRATLGPVEKLTATRQARDYDRQHADTFTETGGRGGGAEPVKPNGGDPLKGVDPAYIAEWKRRGYTQEQMVAEAKYINPRRQKPRSSPVV